LPGPKASMLMRSPCISGEKENNRIIIDPAVSGIVSTQHTVGAYYAGSGASSSVFRSSGARFICSL
jgi:hypothetical protein